MWSRVIPLLDELGVPNVAVQLPSGLPESATDDAACVRSFLDESVDPVVLVGHSMGGMVVTEVGSHPRVKRLVYLDALMLDAGDEMFAVGAGEFAGGFVACMQEQDDGFAWDTDAFAAYLTGRGWSATDAQEFVLGCRPQRAARRCWRTLTRHGGPSRPRSCPVTTAR